MALGTPFQLVAAAGALPLAQLMGGPNTRPYIDTVEAFSRVINTGGGVPGFALDHQAVIEAVDALSGSLFFAGASETMRESVEEAAETIRQAAPNTCTTSHLLEILEPLKVLPMDNESPIEASERIRQQGRRERAKGHGSYLAVLEYVRAMEANPPESMRAQRFRIGVLQDAIDALASLGASEARIRFVQILMEDLEGRERINPSTEIPFPTQIIGALRCLGVFPQHGQDPIEHAEGLWWEAQVQGLKRYFSGPADTVFSGSGGKTTDVESIETEKDALTQERGAGSVSPQLSGARKGCLPTDAVGRLMVEPRQKIAVPSSYVLRGDLSTLSLESGCEAEESVSKQNVVIKIKTVGGERFLIISDSSQTRPLTYHLMAERAKGLHIAFNKDLNCWAHIRFDYDKESGESSIFIRSDFPSSRYRLDQQAEVRRGGMGEVYRARDLTFNRSVAIKVVRDDINEPSERRKAEQRFSTELRLAGQFTSSPHTIPVFDAGKTADGRPFVVMEYVDGRDLDQVLQDEEYQISFGGKQFDLERRIGWGTQVVAGVAEAHQKGIVHRDIKPGNVMITKKERRARLFDFGIATEASEEGITYTDHYPPGTPVYMAPECLRLGDKKGDRKSTDVYSLGVLLYELLTGQLPFSFKDREDAIQYVCRRGQELEQGQDTPIRPEDLTPERNIPKALSDIAMRALSPDFQDRYQDADGMLFDLVTWKAQEYETEAEEHLRSSISDMRQRDICVDRWREGLEKALREYRTVYELYRQEAITARIVELNRKLYGYAYDAGKTDIARIAAEEILFRDPHGEAAQQIGQPVRFKFVVDQEVADLKTLCSSGLRLTLHQFANRGGHLEWNGTRRLFPDDIEDELGLPHGAIDYPLYALAVDGTVNGKKVHSAFIPLPFRRSGKEPHTIRIPLYGFDEIPPDFLIIPAGHVTVKNAPSEELGGVIFPDDIRTIDHDFAMGPKVSNKNYVRWLIDLSCAGNSVDSLIPIHWNKDLFHEQLRQLLEVLKTRGTDEGIVMEELSKIRILDENRRELHFNAAVTGVPYDNALAYLEWCYPNRGVRLPEKDELLLAIRGHDKRTYPWGNALPSSLWQEAAWRILASHTEAGIPVTTRTLDVSPWSIREPSTGMLVRGIYYLVSGTLSFILMPSDRSTRKLYFHAAGCHEVDTDDPLQVAEWALLFGGGSAEDVSPVTVEALKTDRRDPKKAQHIKKTAIIPVIPLKKAQPTPSLETLVQ